MVWCGDEIDDYESFQESFSDLYSFDDEIYCGFIVFDQKQEDFFFYFFVLGILIEDIVVW